MKISIKRENEEILTKLDRISGFCSNTKENIESMIVKYSADNINYTESNIKEDLKVVSTNLDAIMNFVDPIFKHYLVLPANVENENAPYFLNTRKSDNLVKYENSLLELNTPDKNFTDTNFYNNLRIDSLSSPQNLNNYTASKDSEATNSKIKENINNISRILSEKLKKNVKDTTGRFSYKSEIEKKHLSELNGLFESTKKMLNKK